MAMIGRKQPAAPAQPAQTRARPRPGATGGGGAATDNSRVGRLRGNVRDIVAELRKVTWPTREETRNLTIVVIGISATIGVLLGLLDYALSALYNFIKGMF